MMTNDEINYFINELAHLQASEWWKIMTRHLEEQIAHVSNQLDTPDSDKNVIKYNEYDLIRHDKFILKGMKDLIPMLINQYTNQKSPNGDFEQV